VHDNNKPQCGLHCRSYEDKAVKATNKFFSAAYCRYHHTISSRIKPRRELSFRKAKTSDKKIKIVNVNKQQKIEIINIE